MTSQVNFDNWVGDDGNAKQTVVQVQHKILRTTWSQSIANGTTWYDTPLEVAITPSSANNKILIMVSAHMGTGYWELQGRLTRNGTPIGIGDARGSRSRCGFATLKYDTDYDDQDWFPIKYNYLDSPSSTSTVVYTVQLSGYSTFDIHLNRTHNNFDGQDYYGCPVSTITLMEIAQ